MSKLKSFDKLDRVKIQSNKSNWIILSVSVLIVTIIIFSSYAKYLSTSKEVAIANSTTGDFYYREDLLNGTDPVLTDNLIPVTISDTGSVAKADLYNEWYKYEDKKWANAVKLFEKEVTTVKDSSGKGHDGTVYGNLVEGYGYAAFDGSNDYIDTGISSDYDFGTSFSIAIKFVYNIDENIYRRRMLHGGTLDVYLQNDGKFVASFACNSSTGTIEYRSVYLNKEYFENNKVYNFVVVYDGSSLKLYEDGEVIQKSNVSNQVDSGGEANFCVGGACTSTGVTNKYNNNIYYVSLSSGHFSENEVREYYKNGEFSNKEDLLFEYKFYDAYEEDMTDIAEDDIESYFVWIPKYSYQLFDLGNYNNVTSVQNKEQTINIKFGKKNTTDGVLGECTTPGTAGSSGNCVVGSYMTHPAFLAFDTTGFWVGKFETGYEGATTTTDAEVNVSDSNKAIIKPNIYSWRSIALGNAFKTSYEYDRTNESHLLKNTEWGAIAYLSHSVYGINKEIRVNNNLGYITGYSAVEAPTLAYNNLISVEGNRIENTELGVDGTYTLNYFNTSSVLSSTTGNYTGLFDISGGASSYVMGYTTGLSEGMDLSGITNLYTNFFNESYYEKYYDLYQSVAFSDYNNRILGDATGEMGPFFNQTDPDESVRSKSSWYDDYAIFADTNYPWFTRGGAHGGTSAGAFAFHFQTGGINSGCTFRIVLAPAN